MLGTTLAWVSGYTQYASGYVQQTFDNGTTVLLNLCNTELKNIDPYLLNNCYIDIYSQIPEKYEVIVTGMYEVVKTYGMGTPVMDAVKGVVNDLVRDAVRAEKFYANAPKEYIILAVGTGMVLAQFGNYLSKRRNTQPQQPQPQLANLQANNVAVIIDDTPKRQSKKT
ncbi:MAG: hypothetical protein BGO43_07450 [Gammaproteobacteria bacterium 39-13]|nr:hypothetical protein [Gammaproteobacteria bacterium]OJV91410.1 MAG: hypothetical protein BGO43_07450 [Gammaproteobacteria bacterium 39-13]